VMMKLKFIFLLLSLMLFLPSQANAEMAAWMQEASDNMHFKPYEYNGIFLKHPIGHDHASLEIDVSGRYFFKDENTNDSNLLGFNPFFSYTAKSDFFYTPFHDTRPSGPVISRYQNPALHFKYVHGNSGLPNILKAIDTLPIEWADIGIEHISNGQTLDAYDDNNRATILAAVAEKNYTVLDSISRTSASIALTLSGNYKLKPIEFINKIGLSDDNYQNEVTGKVFFRHGQESKVFWGRYANNDVNYNTFQLVQLQWKIFLGATKSKNMPKQLTIGANFGNTWLADKSLDLMLNLPCHTPVFGTVPFTISSHIGPMSNLSNYSEKENTILFGLAFAY
ncbi:MAG: hypothetical protein HOO97_01025, partial [Sideroxydans sp.]|nr:hypothetical protein [Sideroxydans sp.]